MKNRAALTPLVQAANKSICGAYSECDRNFNNNKRFTFIFDLQLYCVCRKHKIERTSVTVFRRNATRGDSFSQDAWG
jgi:hypothetical protein